MPVDLDDVADELVRNGHVGLVGNLHDQTPALHHRSDLVIDLDYVLSVGQPIHAFPAVLEGKINRQTHTYVIVVIDSGGNHGYFWDVNDSENRDNNYRRIRNGMNSSTFEDCDFYFVNTPTDPCPSWLSGDIPANDAKLYAPLKSVLARQKREAAGRSSRASSS